MLKRSSRIAIKKEIPHPLESADMLSSSAWMKWAKKQEKNSIQHHPQQQIDDKDKTPIGLNDKQKLPTTHFIGGEYNYFPKCKIYKLVQNNLCLYCGDSPKYFIQWISTDEEEINAINDGWVLVREDKENKISLLETGQSSATIRYD